MAKEWFVFEWASYGNTRHRLVYNACLVEASGRVDALNQAKKLKLGSGRRLTARPARPGDEKSFYVERRRTWGF
jgi:hypothetical protein